MTRIKTLYIVLAEDRPTVWAISAIDREECCKSSMAALTLRIEIREFSVSPHAFFTR